MSKDLSTFAEEPPSSTRRKTVLRQNSKTRWSVFSDDADKPIVILKGSLIPTRQFLHEIFEKGADMIAESIPNEEDMEKHATGIGEYIYGFDIKTNDDQQWTYYSL